MSTPGNEQSIDILGILDILPHRYPFVMVDRILDIEEGKSITGLKNVTINEPFFQGHFPAEPVFPGVLVMEGLAQVGAILAYKSIPGTIGTKLVYFTGMDKVRFRKVVKPGDQLILKQEIIRLKARLSKMQAGAFVNGELVAEAVLMAGFVDPPDRR